MSHNKVCLLGPYSSQGVSPELAKLLQAAQYTVISIDTDDNTSQNTDTIIHYTYKYNTLIDTLHQIFKKHNISLVVIDPLLFSQPFIPIQAHTPTTLQRYINDYITTCTVFSQIASQYLCKLQQSNIVYILPMSTIIHATLPAQTHVSIISGALRNLAIGLFEDVRENNVKVSILYCNALRVVPPKLMLNTQPNDLQLLSDYMRVAPDDMIQSSDVCRALLYLCKQGPHAITNVLILQTQKQPIKYLHSYINPNREALNIKFAKHVTSNATEYGTQFGTSNRRKWALITGASDGIGLEAAVRLASMQYDLVLIARRAENLQQVAALCKQNHNVNTFTYSVDVSNLDAFKLACTDAVNKLGTKNFNVLLGNAGINKRRSIVNADPTLLDQVVKVNYTANQYLTAWFAPILAHNKAGSIVFSNSLAVSSLAIAAPGTNSYFSSKFALAGWANSVYEDLREFGVQVSSLFVGLVNNALGNTPGPIKYTRNDGQTMIQNSDVADAIQYCVQQNNQSKTTAATHLHLHLQAILFPSNKALFDKLQSRDYSNIEHTIVKSNL